MIVQIFCFDGSQDGHKGLLVWNITLSIVLVGGLLAGYFYVRNYNTSTGEELATLRHMEKVRGVAGNPTHVQCQGKTWR